MNIETNLNGRLRNTSLPASNGMLSVYEANENSRKKRTFTFDAKYGVSEPAITDAKEAPRCTQVRLIGFARGRSKLRVVA